MKNRLPEMVVHFVSSLSSFRWSLERDERNPRDIRGGGESLFRTKKVQTE